MTHGSPPTSSGRVRAGRVTPRRWATGTAVRPYRATVATMTRKVTGRIFDAPPTWWAASVAAKVVAVAAATMPRGAIQPMNARSPLVSSVRMVAKKATSGRVTSTRTATRPRVGSTRPCSDSGVTVAEMATNRTPMISCTRVSKNGRLAGTWNARRFATASPIKIAAMSPASSRTMSQAAATPTTHASWAVVASTSSRSSLHRHTHSTATPTTAPAAPMTTDRKNCPSGWASPPLVLASTAWNTTAPRMPPTGSISEPSQDSIRWRRSDGRTKASSGPTTVGPDTTKIAPSISAAPADMPSSGPASTAANAIVIGTPQITRRGTTRRARPRTLPHCNAKPES